MQVIGMVYFGIHEVVIFLFTLSVCQYTSLLVNQLYDIYMCNHCPHVLNDTEACLSILRRDVTIEVPQLKELVIQQIKMMI